jgi:folylpolyglutamate synthase/dihydropteroate synthase
MLNDKDFNKSAKVLSSLKGKFIVTDVPSVRQTSGQSVYECIKNYIPDATYIPNYEDAYTYARSVSKKDFVCIAGSLYLAGVMRTFINKNSHFPSKEK